MKVDLINDYLENNQISEYYIDKPNIARLKKFNLPIIENLVILFKSLTMTQNDVAWFFGVNNRKNYLYKKFYIPKKNGDKRTIEIPTDKLMNIQKAINKSILSKMIISKYAIGYQKGKSICDNASPHINAKTLIKFDIKDFFPSIGFYKVYKYFLMVGYGKRVSAALTKLCMNPDDVLPQGAPTSPALSNIVCYKMDIRIGKYCEHNELNYTRYADDITISSKRRLTKREILKIKNVIRYIVEGNKKDDGYYNGEGFILNEDKFKYFYSGSRMLVTGLVTNDKLNISKEKIREVENALRYSIKFGLDSHLKFINYREDRITYCNYLLGMILFIKMVNKEKGEKLYKEYLKLFDNEGTSR